MARMPKFPKGLKARLAKEKRLAERKKMIEARKREIEKTKAEITKLRKQRRGY